MSRYYDKIMLVEAFSEALPNTVELPPSNPFWDPIPAGMMLTYDGSNIPNGYAPLPALTAEDQARVDLRAAGVTVSSILHAQYMNDRGDSALLAAIDAAVDAVVISSGLTLSQVSGLM